MTGVEKHDNPTSYITRTIKWENIEKHKPFTVTH